MSSPIGKLFLILGPSGVGKGTIIRLLKERYGNDFVFVLSATTRSPRPGEKEGESYYYLSEDDFKEKIQNFDFLEWAVVHEDFYYGTLKKPIYDALNAGKNVIKELDIHGFERLQKVLPSDEYVSIFLLPPSVDILRKRIKERAPISDDELEKRLQSSIREIEKSAECHYLVQTEDTKIEETLHDVLKVFQKEIPGFKRK